MTLRVRVTPEAQADLDEAQYWYEAARLGLGLEFLDDFDLTVRRAADWPEAAPIVSGTTRRVLASRFPYGVFYSVEADDLVVLGCIHVRRNPRLWRRRVR